MHLASSRGAHTAQRGWSILKWHLPTREEARGTTEWSNDMYWLRYLVQVRSQLVRIGIISNSIPSVYRDRRPRSLTVLCKSNVMLLAGSLSAPSHHLLASCQPFSSTKPPPEAPKAPLLPSPALLQAAVAGRAPQPKSHPPLPPKCSSPKCMR